MPDRSFFFPLLARPAAVPAARHRVTAQVTAWGSQIGQEAREKLELAASELVTNAVRHTATAVVGVRVTLTDQLLRLEVFDASSHLPAPAPAGEDGESGRGLALVAQIADRHGHTPTRRGKVAWAEFDLPPISRPAARLRLLVRASHATRRRPPAWLHAV